MKDVGVRLKVGADGLENLTALTRELDKSGVATDEFDAKAKALSAEFERLAQQQALIDQFKRTKTAVDDADTAMRAAQNDAQSLAREIAATEAPTKAQTTAFEKARTAVNSADQAYRAQVEQLQQLRTQMGAAGISTDQLAAAQVRVHTQLDVARKGVADLTGELQQLSGQQGGVRQFEQLAVSTETARVALQAADTALESYRREMAAAGEPTRAQTGQLARLTDQVRQAQVAFLAESGAQAQAGAALRAGGVGADQLAAATGRARQQAASGTAAAEKLAQAYRDEGAAATKAGAEQAAASAKAQAALDGINAKLSGLKNLGIAGILGSQTVQLLKGVTETADAYSNLASRVRLVTGEGPPFEAAMLGIQRVALGTNSTLEATGTLYSRIAAAGKTLGVGQQEALALTQTINQAVQISGASATASDAAITQLIQSLQSGVLRGDEFNSVMEQAPRLASALAAGLGVTIGQLRNLAETGQLTSATVIKALRSQKDVVEKEFGQLPATVGRALTNLSTQWTVFVGDLNKSSGATGAIAAGINKLADNLDTVAQLAAVAGSALTVQLAVKGVAALRAFAADAALAGGASRLLAADIAKIPAVVNITIATVGFEIGFKIGEMLYENTALARKLGVALVDFFEQQVSRLQLVKEAAAAIFTDDTIAKAFERYQQRGKDLQDTFTQLVKDAEQAPGQVRAAADAAADAAKRMGAANVQAGAQIADAAAGATTAIAGTGAAATQAGAQIGSAAGGAASGLAGVGQAAATAKGEIQGLAQAAGLNLPTIGVSAAEQAKAIVDLAAKSKTVAQVLGTQIPDAVKKLSGPELDQFRTAFANAVTASIEDSKRLAAELIAAGKSGGAALAAAQAKAQLLQQVLLETGKQAAQSLGVDVVAASKTLSTEFLHAQENLSVLIRSMPVLKSAGIDATAVVSQAFAKMIDDAKSQAEIDAITTRLKAMGAAGQIGGDQVAAGLKLAADKAIELRDKIDDVTPGIQSLREAARKAGVDIGELTTGVGKGFKDALVDVTNLNDQIVKAGISAQTAGPLLVQAIDQRIGAAKTREELQLLDAAVKAIGADSKITGAQTAEALEKIRLKAVDVKLAATGVTDAWKRLGVDIADSSTQSSTQLINDYEKIKASGTGTPRQIQQAFATMAAAVIRANDGVVPEWLKVEAATRGAKIAVDEYGNAVIKWAKDGKDAIDALAGSFDSVSAAADKARNAAVKSKLATNKYEKDAAGNDTFAVDDNGQRISIDTPATDHPGLVFDKARYDRDAQAAFRSGINQILNPENYWVAEQPVYHVPAPAPKPASQPSGGGGGGSSSTAYSPAPAPVATAPAPAPTVHNVNLSLNGGPTTQVSVTSTSDAAAIESFLLQLAQAKAAGG